MKINQMKDFQEICKKNLVESYKAILGKDITLDNTFIVWSVKVLQNFKSLASTNFLYKKRNKVLKNT